ncbi:hypothetical protein [Vibrio phage LV6]|nr:hypothetical protein [Vibrio phage LV6]
MSIFFYVVGWLLGVAAAVCMTLSAGAWLMLGGCGLTNLFSRGNAHPLARVAFVLYVCLLLYVWYLVGTNAPFDVTLTTGGA